MKLIHAGGECDNNCFAKFGGCRVHKAEKEKELSSQEIALQLGKFTAQEEQVFIYTPDMFSDRYYESLFKHLPCYDGGIRQAYFAINGSVREMIDKKIKTKELIDRSIREVWLGVESASPEVRDAYNKPKFTNEEVIHLTTELQDAGIHVCWYLLDSELETDASKAEMFNMIQAALPYRVRIWPLG